MDRDEHFILPPGHGQIGDIFHRSFTHFFGGSDLNDASIFTPMHHDIRQVLSAGAVLTGLEVTSNGSARANSQSELLKRRLSDFSARLGSLSLPDIDGALRDDLAAYARGSEAIETTSKALTARSALILLAGIEAAISLELRQLPPTEEAPPILGARDIKVTSQLGALVARWGLAASVQPGIVPPSLRDDGLKKAGTTPSPNAIVMAGDAMFPLETASKTVARMMLPKDDPSCSRFALDPLPPLLLPQVLTPLLAALIQLGWRQSPGSASAGDTLHSTEENEWARRDAARLVNQCVVASHLHLISLTIYPVSKLLQLLPPCLLFFRHRV
jgi:hypothetical protein